jgi:hypothetical protein
LHWLGVSSAYKNEQMRELILAKIDSFQQETEANQEKLDAFQEEMRANSDEFEVL